MASWTAKAAPLKGMPIAVQHHSWIYLEKLARAASKSRRSSPSPACRRRAAISPRCCRSCRATPAKLVIRAAYEDDRPSAFIAEHANIPAVTLPFTVGGTDQAQGSVQPLRRHHQPPARGHSRNEPENLEFGILLPAFLAGLLVLATHVPLGQQVLNRGIVFIDLAIAQVAGLGVTAAGALRLRSPKAGACRPRPWSRRCSARCC